MGWSWYCRWRTSWYASTAPVYGATSQRFRRRALPAIGLAATVAYQRFIVGDRATPFDLAWQGDRAHVAPWKAVADSWNFVASFGDPIEVLNVVCLLGFVVLGILLLVYRLRLTYAVYAWAYLAVAASREWGTVLGGMNRVVLVLFPCFMVLSLWLIRRPRLAAAVAADQCPVPDCVVRVLGTLGLCRVADESCVGH